MQQHAKALKFVTVGTLGAVAATLLLVSMFQFAVQRAEATPVIGQGKPCNACHTSSSPSKSDVKK
jgi:cytochrome c551/c552